MNIKARIAKLAISLWVLLPGVASTAHSQNAYAPLPLPAHQKFSTLYKDSSLFQYDEVVEQEIAELENIEQDNGRHRDYRKTMLQFLRVLRVKRAFRNTRYKERLYTDLANIAAKLKLYPLTMQFSAGANSLPGENNTTAVNITGGVYSIAMPGIAIDLDTTEINIAGNTKVESEPVSTNDILQSFDDGKEAGEYALIVHVKQPSPGKRKAFTGIDNVGHMFITLIKYNTDNSYVTRSFGFYPHKKGVFSATPFHPSAPPVFKDDALHDWDEAIGKFISNRRFVKIIQLLTKYDCKMYNLNYNNCTDFGLAIASLSGISITDTKGKWPLGKGNNPANAGQSILEDKVSNADTNNREGIFIFKNAAVRK